MEEILMKKALAALSALVLATVSLFSNANVFAAEYYDMTVTVDMQSAGKPISPYIYGINQYGHQGDYNKVAVNTVRQGGNRMTAYNWETNASNAGSDWKYSSDNNLSNSSRPADCVQVLSAEGQKYDFDYKLTTLQLAGYVAADMNGTVTAEETAPSARWNKVELVKDAPFADTLDLTDGTVYMDEYVNYIIRTLGNSQSDTGIQGYSLDNEPALWGNTHSRIHPQPVTIAELTEKSVTMAAAVKKLDPNAEIFGPALYGYTAYDHLADDDATNEWKTLRDVNGYHWYIDCYLDQMKQASEKSGVRLLDVLDIHYYSESAREGAADRVQSVRTLYEKGFRENSWIGQWCQENVPILPAIQASIDKYYPGTKIGITEYNFGGDSDMSGAIAQAEALGCYADQGVYYATLWGGGGYIFSGMNLYTNYDGKGGSFGDTLLPAVTENVAMSSAYAAINADDDSTMTVMVTNKDESTAERATIVLDGAKKQYKAAAVYAVYDDSTDIRLIDVVDVTDDTVQVTLPAYAAAMVVISDDVLDVQPDVKPEYKSETFSDPMSLVNADGYVEIPISDPEHLKKIIMTADVRSSAGSAWGNAGCALSINAVDANGMRFWTSEGYSLNLGTDSTATVEFDGTLWYDEEKIPAQIADGKVELQKWWDVSEKQEQDIPDEITVTYKNVEVIYEYPAEQPVQVRSDVNAGGKFNIVDVMLLQKWLLAVPDTHLANWEAGDLCEDNRLNVFDLCLMKRELINSRA